jgi:hypothetical protein
MPEMRVSHLLIVVVLVGAVLAVVLVFTGVWAGVGWFNTQNLNKIADRGAQTASGYPPAKTPTEAMDKFREAIHARKYKFAAAYCTKPYGDQLVRASEGAAALGEEIDHIERYANNKGIMTDKLAYFLHQLDPFPKNFKTAAAPEQKGDKAYGAYVFDAGTLKAIPTEMTNMDSAMFVTVLRPMDVFGNKLELVKEGEEWKLNIPTSGPFETRVGYFNDHWKAYHTGLHSLSDDLTREKYASKTALEQDVLQKLREAK